MSFELGQNNVVRSETVASDDPMKMCLYPLDQSPVRVKKRWTPNHCPAKNYGFDQRVHEKELGPSVLEVVSEALSFKEGKGAHSLSHSRKVGRSHAETRAGELDPQISLGRYNLNLLTLKAEVKM